MAIIYCGQYQESGYLYSSYRVGIVTYDYVKDQQKERFIYDFYDPYFQTLLVRHYLKTNDEILYNWLNETKSKHGGLLVDNYNIELHLLIIPGSIEETALRLSFDIKVVNQ